MMGFGLNIGLVEIIEMLLFWGALLATAIWLLSLLFPVAKSKKSDRSNSLKR